MITISPFKALRPAAQYAKQVASPPYDVLSGQEAKIAAQGNPISYLHITKSEIDLPDNLSPYAEEVYAKAKENLKAFISRETLFIENKPCYYIYQLTMPMGDKSHTQTGLVCCSSIKNYEKGLIKKHEHTRPEKELDRINHIRVTSAQTGNVFLAYTAVKEIDKIINDWSKEKNPVYDFVASDNIQHTIWIINNSDTIDEITDIFRQKVPCTYIADGHHRAASAAKAREFFESIDAECFLTTLFPSNQLQILPYNRIIKDLNQHSPQAFLEKLEGKFHIEKQDRPVQPTQPYTFGMYLDRQWYLLSLKDIPSHQDPIESLDISILQKEILEPILGIADQRTDKRIDFVGGIRGLKELEQKVNNGYAIAFSLYPVSMDQLFNVADMDVVMPPKSTWFEPKLRDGLLTHYIGS